MKVLVQRVGMIPAGFQVFADYREHPALVWIVKTLITDDHARELQAELCRAVRKMPDRDQFANELLSALRRHLPTLAFQTDQAGTLRASPQS